MRADHTLCRKFVCRPCDLMVLRHPNAFTILPGLDCLSFQQRAPARVAGGKVPEWMRMIAHTVEFQHLRCATAPLPTLLPSTALLPRRQTSCPACLNLRCTEQSQFEILAGVCGGPDICPTSLAPAEALHSIGIEHMHGDWQTCTNFDRPRNNGQGALHFQAWLSADGIWHPTKRMQQ